MLTSTEYIRQSLETNLFFLRIMKEHMIFASAALTPKDSNLKPILMNMKNMYENLLMNTVALANGVIRPKSLTSGDIITQFTYKAEIATQYYTVIPINSDITRMEIALVNNPTTINNPALEQQVNVLNQQNISMVFATINMQKDLLNMVLTCKSFTTMYPLMLDHVTREAEHYLEHLQTLQKRQSLTDGPAVTANMEVFWNTIMGDHSKFIRGMLDPSEDELITKANTFAMEFDVLIKAAKEAMDKLDLLAGVTQKSVEKTTELRNFKEQGTEGILDCKVKSIILPLLSDHVLREANHYLKELKEIKV